jgi:hypothetical protein
LSDGNGNLILVKYYSLKTVPDHYLLDHHTGGKPRQWDDGPANDANPCVHVSFALDLCTTTYSFGWCGIAAGGAEFPDQEARLVI